MMQGQDIRDRLKDIEDFLLDEYKENKEEKKRDWRTYEQRLMNRIKGAIKNLEPLIDEATNFEIHRGQGRKPELDYFVIKSYYYISACVVCSTCIIKIHYFYARCV